MPLQIRRGTDAERQLLAVPLADGELLWTTDLKQLFVGDGVTLAQNASPVVGYNDENAQDAASSLLTHSNHTGLTFTYDDGTGQVLGIVDISNESINDLSDVDTTGISNGEPLIFNSTSGNFEAGSTITANLTGSVTGNLTGNVTGDVTGDLTGSVFADDSTKLIDGESGTIVAARLVGTTDITTTGLHIGEVQGSVFGDDSTLLVNSIDSAINLSGTVKGNIIPDANETYDIGSNSLRFNDLYLSGSSLFLGDAQITASGSAVNLPAGSTINGEPLGEITQPGNALQIDILGEDSSLIVNSATGALTGDLTGNILSGNGTVIFSNGFDGTTATFENQLTVNGQLRAQTGIISDLRGSVFGDDSSLIINGETNTITAVSIDVDTLNTGGLASDNQELDFQSTTGSSTISINSIDDAGILALRKISDADLSGTSPAYGRIVFARDDANGPAVNALVSGTDLALTFAVDDTGTFADNSKFFVWTGSRFGIGTASPSDTLDVNGTGKFAGDVEAAAFKGSVVSDDSTIMIDAVENTITAGGFIQFGSLTSTDRDNLTAANGMVIYNTTNNKFEGYQNGAWINLDDGTAAS